MGSRSANTQVGQLFGGSFNLFTPGFGTFSIQSQDRFNAFANFNHEVYGKNLELFGQFLYTGTKSEGQLAPTLANALVSYKLAVPADNPYNVFEVPLDNLSNGLAPRTRFEDVGARQFVYETDYYRFIGGLKGEINADYSWEAAYNYNQSSQLQKTQNAVNGAALNLALQPDFSITADPVSGAPLPFPGYYSRLTDFNGFAVPTYNFLALPGSSDNSQNTIDNLKTTLFNSGTSKLWSADAVVRGTPFELPAGKVGFAVGGQYIYQSLEVTYDGLLETGLVPGLNPAKSFPARNLTQWAGFVEAVIPVVSPDMDIPAFHSFEVNAAGRYNTFEPLDVDKAVPKVGVKWQPLDDQVTLRGSYSQGFITPSMFSLFGPTVVSVPNVSVGGESFQGNVQYPSNPNLLPAEATTYTAGFVYAPKQVKNLTANFGYYYVTEDGQEYNPDYNAMLSDLDANGANSQWANNFFFLDGQSMAQKGSTAAGQINSGNYGSLTVPLLPGAAQTTSGFEMGAQWSQYFEGLGTMTFRCDANYVLRYDYSNGPGEPFYDYAGFITDEDVLGLGKGTIPKFQVIPSAIWSNWGFTYVVRARYIPSMESPGFVLFGDKDSGITLDGSVWTVDSYYTIDMQLSYLFDAKGAQKWYDKTELTVGCNNVTSNLAPAIAGTFEDNTDKSTYDIVGAFIYFQIAKKF